MSAKAFDLKKLEMNKGAFDADGWQEFLKVPSLSCGLYILPAGATDTQTPHDQDEVYYVIEGEGTLVSGEPGRESRLELKPGSILFVARHQKHRFENFASGIKLLVFFSAAT